MTPGPGGSPYGDPGKNKRFMEPRRPFRDDARQHPRDATLNIGLPVINENCYLDRTCHSHNDLGVAPLSIWLDSHRRLHDVSHSPTAHELYLPSRLGARDESRAEPAFEMLELFSSSVFFLGLSVHWNLLQFLLEILSNPESAMLTRCGRSLVNIGLTFCTCAIPRITQAIKHVSTPK